MVAKQAHSVGTSFVFSIFLFLVFEMFKNYFKTVPMKMLTNSADFIHTITKEFLKAISCIC